MDRTWFIAGSLLAFLAVAAGAFGAHAVKGQISADALNTYETAARYHLIHAVALLGVAFAAHRWGGGLATIAGWLILVGVLIFSGSLYMLALTGVRWLGAVAPIGGAGMLGGWLLLVVAVWKSGN